jgi:hypothetical protein
LCFPISIVIIIETLSLSGTPTRNVPRISIYFLPLELHDGAGIAPTLTLNSLCVPNVWIQESPHGGKNLSSTFAHRFDTSKFFSASVLGIKSAVSTPVVFIVSRLPSLSVLVKYLASFPTVEKISGFVVFLVVATW